MPLSMHAHNVACRFPGGLKERSAQQQLEKDPTEILRKAVYGMLPKNKLRDVRIGLLPGAAVHSEHGVAGLLAPFCLLPHLMPLTHVTCANAAINVPLC